MKKLRIGLAGTGFAGEVHAKALQEVTGAELVAAYNRSSKRGKAFAEEWGVDFQRDYGELLDRDDIDLIDVCTASGTHGDFAVAAATAEKHLIVEKPLEITPERCDKIITSADQNGVTLSVIFQNRYKPSVQRLREALEEDSFGRLIMGEASVKWFRAEDYYQTDWKGTKEYDGGGALLNQSIHTIDLLQWMMGKVRSVYGRIDTLYHDIEAEDAGVAVLEFEDGALGTIHGSTAIYPGLKEGLSIHGTKGSAEIEGDSIKTWEFSSDNMEEVKKESSEEDQGGSSSPQGIDSELHRKQLQEIVDAIKTGSSLPIDGKEGKKAVKIIDAIYRSSREGEPITPHKPQR